MSEQEYGFLARTLHALALGNSAAEVSFDLERALYGRNLKDSTEGRHAFVAGLARAGTTILMRQIYATGGFRSLTYRDAPFVLAPNMWHALSARSQKVGVARERAHGDGMEHSYDSPEALEEVFWRVFCGNDYIRPHQLVPMQADAEVIEKFRVYVALMLRGFAPGRYLSKNNNNVLRLSSLTAAFPRAVILIPFREPLAQAHSLLAQHRRFLRVHEEDPFSARYMRWFGHHEFGSDHRPFAFGSDRLTDADRDRLQYWIELWIHVYAHLIKARPAGTLFTSYEELCAEPERAWPTICRHLDLDVGTPAGLLRSPHPPAVTEDCDEALLRRARDLHRELLASAVVGPP